MLYLSWDAVETAKIRCGRTSRKTGGEGVRPLWLPREGQPFGYALPPSDRLLGSLDKPFWVPSLPAAKAGARATPGPHLRETSECGDRRGERVVARVKLHKAGGSLPSDIYKAGALCSITLERAGTDMCARSGGDSHTNVRQYTTPIRCRPRAESQQGCAARTEAHP